MSKVMDFLQTGRRRALRLKGLRFGGVLSLSQGFLAAAVIVVASAMLFLGSWIGFYLQSSITAGVAATAAASIESLIAHEMRDISTELPLTEASERRLNDVFQIGNEADTTRLLQIRIRSLNGETFYSSLGGIMDDLDPSDFRQAAEDGEVVARIVDLPLEPVAELTGHDIRVLKLYAPLRRVETNEIFAVAELYYGARSLTDIQSSAQNAVWILVGTIGCIVIAILYVLVDRVSTTIEQQRERLAANLAESRQLSDDNRALHSASEQLRLDASFANETLLSQTGSDLHDGPIQLLTLIILRLSRLAQTASPEGAQTLNSMVAQATEAMDELRNISAGLVLPELGVLSLSQTIHLAIERHEGLTGGHVKRHILRSAPACPMAVRVCAYRVVQESLNNAFRHGNGVGQAVSAQIVAEELVLSISNGVTRAESQSTVRRAGGLGLRGMRFRVEALGGTLASNLTAPSRATVIARIPLDRPAQAS